MTNETNADKELEAEPTNGVYLLEVRAETMGYTIHSKRDHIWASTVTINGNYIGTSNSFELECDNFEIDGDSVDLLFHSAK